MNLIKKYLTRIEESSRRTKLYIGNDALFLTFRHTETAIDLKRSAAKRKKYQVTAVLVLNAFGVQRIEPIHHNYQKYIENVVGKLKYGSIDSQLTLLEAMSAYKTSYGSLCLKLTEVKLEWYL